MTPLALHWPRDGHMIQVIPTRPCYLEICTLRGVTQSNGVGGDSSYRPCSKKTHQPPISTHHPTMPVPLFYFIFHLNSEATPQSPTDSPLFLPHFPFQLATVRLCCLQPLNKPLIFGSNGNAFRKPHFKHTISHLYTFLFPL